MARASLAEYLKSRPCYETHEEVAVGPFVTISRQYGCPGFSLGLLLLDILTENVPPGENWRIYHKDILARLAAETHLNVEFLDHQREAKQHLVVEFFRNLGGQSLPSALEVRRRILGLVRELAMDGYAIIIGQGGALATHDLSNGLNVRIEAPLEWRARQVAFREGITQQEALERIHDIERNRQDLQKYYESRFTVTMAFDLTFDCSRFTLAQIAQQIAYAMKLAGCL